MTADAYLVGRIAGKIQAPYKGVHEVYGGQLLDASAIEKPIYEHCTFANISFKGATLDGGRFLNCAFIGCYFRNANVKNSSFSSCRFINCEFPGASFSACDFRYTRFNNCYIPFSEIEHNLPTEPNLREQLAHNLAREAAALGYSREARTYRLCELKAREAHYWAVLQAKSKWYRDHFDQFARFGIGLRFIGSVLNRVLFGYGESIRVLIRNYLIAAFIVFPLLFYWIPQGLVPPPTGSVSGVPSSFWVALEFSVDNAVIGALGSSIQAVGWQARFLAATERILAAIWVSLVAAYLFRWSLHR
jgi:hypothetical protein